MRNTLLEIPVFLGCIYCGLAIGALYCVFMLLRALYDNALYHGILDGLFYCAAAVMSALALLYLNGGTVRFYAFLGIGLGITAVMLSAGRLFKAIIQAIMSKKKEKLK